MTLRRVSSLIVFLLLVAVGLGWAQRSTFTQTAVNVTTSSSTVLVANKNRNSLMLENNSDTLIYCNFGATAVVNEGTRLGASGGGKLFDVKVPVGTVNCIHGGSGNKVLLVTEGTQ